MAVAKRLRIPSQWSSIKNSLGSPALEILDYLERHPDAEDTIEGILRWWILESCVRSWAPKIAETVTQLVERGLIKEKPSSDGRMFYRLSAEYLAAIQQRLPRSIARDDEH